MKVATIKKKRAQNWFSRYATEMYYSLKAEQQARCEAYSYGYATEEKEFYTEIEKRITFKDVLIMLRGTSRYALDTAA